MNRSLFTRHLTMFVVLYIIFGLATQNFVGTFVGCVVNAIIFQWSQGINNVS